MSLLNFDATTINPNDDYAPLPAGAYPVIISQSEIRDNKAGTGNYLHLEMEVQGGPFAGRKIFDNLTLAHQNPTAVSIGQRRLSQICHGVNVLQPKDSSDLHYKPLVAVIKIRKGDGQYGDSNEVNRYEAAPSMGAVPAHQPPPQPAQSAPAPAPWQVSR